MSKIMNPGLYGASIRGVAIDDAIGVVHFELDFHELEKRISAFNFRVVPKTKCDWNGWRNPIDPEVEKLMKAQPTKPVHSHEPWKQSFKRKSRQVRKSK